MTDDMSEDYSLEDIVAISATILKESFNSDVNSSSSSSSSSRASDAWMVIYENNTILREVTYRPNKHFIIALGTLLTITGVLLNTALLAIYWRNRRRRGDGDRPGMVLSICVAELMTSAVVVPLRVVKEHFPTWPFGLGVCRLWLFLQVYLVSTVTWLLLAETIDRLIDLWKSRADVAANENEKTLSSPAPIRTSRQRHVILCLSAWLVPLVIMTSVGAMTDDDSEFTMADHCVVTVTQGYAIAAAVCAFLGPAAVVVLLSVVLVVVAALMARESDTSGLHHHQVGGLEAPLTLTYDTSSAASTDVIAQATNQQQPARSHALGLSVISLAHVCLWSPLFISTVVVSFCDSLCVQPTTWLFFAWLGHSSATALPALFLLCSAPFACQASFATPTAVNQAAIWHRLHSPSAANKRYGVL